MTYKPGIDIVVVNYRTPGDLTAFLESLKRHPPTCRFTVGVENVEPTDADMTAGRLVAAIPEAVQANLTTHTSNIGYARACNYGAFGGVHDTIALFNADVELTEGALDDCRGALHFNPRWGILGPRQIDEQGRLTHAGIFGTLAQPSLRGWRQRDRNQYSAPRDDAVSVSGSAYFVKRAVWDELATCSVYQAVAPDAVGAFLPTPHYYEETWCSYHAQAHGYKVVYYGPVQVMHRWHRASPVGGHAEKMMPISRDMFRQACDAHGIPHD